MFKTTTTIFCAALLALGLSATPTDALAGKGGTKGKVQLTAVTFEFGNGSGDAIRGTALRMRAAIPIVVTARGYAKMVAAGFGPEGAKVVFDIEDDVIQATYERMIEPTEEVFAKMGAA